MIIPAIFVALSGNVRDTLKALVFILLSDPEP
jgi:hypothetical protein